MFAVFFFLPFFLRKYVCRVLLLLMHTYVVRAPTIQFSVRLRIWWFRFFLFLPYTSAVPWLFYSFFSVVVVISSEIVGHDARIVLVCAMHSRDYVSLSHSAQPHHMINTLANVVVFTIIMSNSRHLLDFVAIYLFHFFWLSVCPSVYYPFTQQ